MLTRSWRVSIVPEARDTTRFSPPTKLEVMRSTETIRECITYPEKTRLIRDAIAKGRTQYGMQTFDQSLYDLYCQGLISYTEAVLGATNADDLKLQLKGVRSGGSEENEQKSMASVAD